MTENIKIWIDALDFQDKGGWKIDTQFVHLMGSGYLIAAAEPGVPVADAKTTVSVPKQGKYRIWVRDRNWYRPHNPGTFSLLVNGEDNGVVLGKQPSDAWIWEIAGDFDLPQGRTELLIRDLTGYFARFSSIIITDDFDYVPAREIDRLHKERAQIKGLDAEIKYCGDYEVIVAGGGPGGVSAAVAAARNGAKTLLLQNRPMLGGNSSPEISIHMDGAEMYNTYSREGGIAEEIHRLRDFDEDGVNDWTNAMTKLVNNEPNLTVVYHSHVCAVDMENEATIKGVTVLDIQQLTKRSYTGKIFIDCTGDAWVGYYAGAKYRFGRESQNQHNEILAPDIADTQTMSGCVRGDKKFFFLKSEEDVEYHAPEWVPAIAKNDAEFGRDIAGNGTRLYWWIEAPNTYDDMWDGEQTRDALFMVLLGFYDYEKNSWSGRDKFKKFRFNFGNVINGRRESRRLIGDYILTENDTREGRVFDDAISYSGWCLDIHHPEGIYSGKKGPAYCSIHVPRPTIPFRCLYSKNIDNLMFAGRNVSTTHIAMGTTRVEKTISTMGQAVGTAAAMCLKLNETPRGIYQRHMHALQQQLIKDDQFIPGLKNEDPNDPCLTATATASSVKTDEIFWNMLGVPGELKPLDVVRSTTFWLARKDGDLTELYLKLHSACAEPKKVTLHYSPKGADVYSIAKETKVFTAEAEVPPMRETWVRFPVDVKLPPNPMMEKCDMKVWLDPAEGISWRSVTDLSYNHKAGIITPDGKEKNTIYQSYCISRTLPEDKIANCSPANVVNGHSRIQSADIYEWVSDPDQDLPQWLELTFAKPAQINRVGVVFDTNMNAPCSCAAFKAPTPPTCVKDYTVEVMSNGVWSKIADVKNNFMRKCNHDFDTTLAEKIRVTASETWGDKSVRIIEIRASQEI